VDEFDDKVPSFSERLRIKEEEFKEKGKYTNILKISKEEVRSLYNLLSKVLRYNLEDKISITEIKKYK
jgi:hypothetical protein